VRRQLAYVKFQIDYGAINACSRHIFLVLCSAQELAHHRAVFENNYCE